MRVGNMGDVNMFSYCDKNFKVLLDLTGNEYWQNIISEIEYLGQKKEVICISRYSVQVQNSNVNLHQLDSVEDIKQLIYKKWGNDEINKLIISNNINHVPEWLDSNFSTVLLLDDPSSYKNLNSMPDEIWSYENFRQFIQNPSYQKHYISEHIGFLNSQFSSEDFIKHTDFLKIPGISNRADIIFTGRYFPLNDNRNYNHPLSRAIVGFKSNYNNHVQAIQRFLAKMIETVYVLDPTIQYITFVPPRPEKESRFSKVKNYMMNRFLLKDNLLYTTCSYESPKNYSSFEDKYRCVQGNIKCKERVSGNVLLIDDVFTSGATVSECAKVLYEAGASRVTVMPLAFTQRKDFCNQRVMPVVFNEFGNEYFIMFRKDTSNAFYSSKNNENEFLGRNFGDVHEEYLNYNRYLSNRLSYPLHYTDNQEIKGIIFDLDNTLLQTDDLEYNRSQGTSGSKLISYNKERIIIDPKYLEKLKQAGIQIGIVTSSPRKYAENLLTKYGYPYDYLVAAKDTLRSKPLPDPLLKCAIKFKVHPQYILHIGDQLSDIQAGQSAGMMNLHIDQVLQSRILEKFI